MTEQVKPCGGGNAVTPTDYKTLEGQRIQGIMAAVAALPGAALVASGPAGAPFFALALGTVAAAFMFWIYTDGIYHFSTIQPRNEVEWSRLLRAGYRYQAFTVAYAAGSIFLTMSGFAAVHSGLRLPISVGTGFAIDMVLFAAVLGHVCWCLRERNAIGVEARAASLANRAAA